MPAVQCHIARSITGRTKAVSSSCLCVCVIIVGPGAPVCYLLFIITARRFPRPAVTGPTARGGGPGRGRRWKRGSFPFAGHTARCSLPPRRHDYARSLGKPRENDQSSCSCACSATACILLCAVRAPRTVLIAYAFPIGRAPFRPTSVAWLRGCDLFSGFLFAPLPHVRSHNRLSRARASLSLVAPPPPCVRVATIAAASLAVRCPCAHT